MADQAEMPAAGCTSFADQADMLGLLMQFEAERISVLRILVNRTGPNPAKLLRELEEAEASGRQILELFNLVYALVPFEREVRDALAPLLEGNRLSDSSKDSAKAPAATRRPPGLPPARSRNLSSSRS